MMTLREDFHKAGFGNPIVGKALRMLSWECDMLLLEGRDMP